MTKTVHMAFQDYMINKLKTTYRQLFGCLVKGSALYVVKVPSVFDDGTTFNGTLPVDLSN